MFPKGARPFYCRKKTSRVCICCRTRNRLYEYKEPSTHSCKYLFHDNGNICKGALIFCRFCKREGEGKEVGWGWECSTVGLLGAYSVGQDTSLWWRQLSVGIHGPWGVSLWKWHPLQSIAARAESAPAVGPAAAGPSATGAVGDRPQQPVYHLHSHSHGPADLHPQPRPIRYPWPPSSVKMLSLLCPSLEGICSGWGNVVEVSMDQTQLLQLLFLTVIFACSFGVY